MTQNEIISMAQDSGVWNELGYSKCLERFAALVAAHEREACAKVCENGMIGDPSSRHDYERMNCAAVIRARCDREK